LDTNGTRPPAIASGGPLRLEAAGSSVAACLFQRVMARPGGLLRSYRSDGQHRCTSYSAAWSRSGAIAALLARNGARPGRHVVILADDVVDFTPAYWACLRGGHVAIALMDAAREAIHRSEGAFNDIIAALEAPIFLIDDSFAELIGAHRAPLRGEVVRLSAAGNEDHWQDAAALSDPACLIATSGSTGTPKLAILTNRTLIARNFAAVASGAGGLPDALGVFPLDTMSGQFALYLHYQSWTHIRAQDLIARPSVVLDAVEELGLAGVGLTSSLLRRILAQEQRQPRVRHLASLRSVGIGSEPVSAGLMQDLSRMLQNHGASAAVIQAGYGTTETGALVTASKRGLHTDPSLPASLGRPSPGVDMRIVGEDGNGLAEGDIGEVQVRCPDKMFSGYWRDPKPTPDGLTNDGWWRTGDVGEIRGGELTLHGRVREVLIVGGKKMSLVAIDHHLQASLESGDEAHCFVQRKAGLQEQLGIAVRCDDPRPSHYDATVARMRSEIARRFGVKVELVRQVDDFPRTRNGKLRRDELADIGAASPRQETSAFLRDHAWEGAEELVVLVTRVWSDALGVSPSVDPNADFFALGGDSLRALTLYTQLSDVVGVRIESDAFFTNPTLSHLLLLVEAALASAGSTEPTTFWPLSAALHRTTLAPLETWPGVRPTPSRLVVGHHTEVDAPPVFFVLNTRFELDQLLGSLGNKRPIYAFRSALAGRDFNEANLQALALRYIADIETICPEGPIFIGGHCQGGVIALAVAQHALRRKRHVPLLILMEWLGELQAYAGRVMLVSGRENLVQNPRLRFAQPERGWQRAFADCEHVEIQGSYALDVSSLGELGARLDTAMAETLAAPTTLMPAEAYRVTIRTEDLTASMRPGERRTIRLTIRNDSVQAWSAFERSGLTVGARWSDDDGHMIQDTSAHRPLPRVNAREAVAVDLDIVAPNERGRFQIHIDICEQGNRWFHRDPSTAMTAPILVAPETNEDIASRSPNRIGMFQRAARYRFDMRSESRHLLRSGWSAPEDWGVWSVGPAATLTLPVAGRRGKLHAVLTLKAFGRTGCKVPVLVKVGQDDAGQQATQLSWTLTANVTTKKRIDLDCAGHDLTIRFLTPEAISPFELGASHDRRKLALGLIEMRFRRIGWF
jgi:acyl-CoA synthetase (AMP-forming)/AMP-acid ligase II/acyl carrier protein